MLKKIIKYIFIYTLCVLFVGCDSILTTNDSCDYCYLELEAPDLWMDEDGYYHLDFIEGSIQTFTTLNVEIAYPLYEVGFYTEEEYIIYHYGEEHSVSLVNQHSYSDVDRIAHTVFGVWEEFVGDTIRVNSVWWDDCLNGYYDYIEIIIDE